ncbi:MAG: hypothetical protein CL878_16060 [Dehalococcoidia bacterium]|nr:hypothetical protein [Dehalococcoidia bacterium]
MAGVMSDAGHSLLEQTRAALEEAHFDPQHAGDVFLRADAEAALQAAFPAASISVAGRDEARLPAARFLGATYRPDILVELDKAQVAVDLTLLRTDSGPISAALSRAVVLSQQIPVATVIVDRRIERANPFAGPARGGLHPGDQAIIDYLRDRHLVVFVIKRQAPFSFG